MRLGLCWLLPLLPLGACASDPHLGAGHDPARYAADLAQCQRRSEEQVRLQNANRPEDWVVSPITGPGMVDAATRRCLGAKGYGPAPSRAGG